MPRPTLSRLKTVYQEMKSTWKISGFKGLYRKYGLKFFLGFFFYYLVRDVTLYILVPWWIAQKALSQ